MNEHNDEQEFEPIESELDEGRDQRRSRGAGLAWLALLIALAAAGYSAYQWWGDQQSGAADQGREQRLQSLEREDSELRQSLQALNERIGQAEEPASVEQVATLERSVAALERSVAALERRLDGIDQTQARARQAMEASLFDLQQSVESVTATVAALTNRSETPGQQLEIHEVKSLLRLAVEHVQLFGDVAAAQRALSLADERLTAMDDPVYLSVRQRIARARQALNDVVLPDLVRFDGRLGALQSAVARWPFPGDETVTDAGDSRDGDGAGLWARVKHTLARLVTVRRQLPEAEAELTIADRDLLRQGLWLQFETARMALVRRSQEVYTRSLERAADTLQNHFDTDAATVRSALAEIESLQDIELNGELPDISAPWSQLQLLSGSGAESPRRGGPASTAARAREPAEASAQEGGGSAEVEGGGGDG